jgi:hypothetical protein
MATPRFAGPPGTTKAPPFGKLSKQAKKSGPQPPIPGKKAKGPSVGKGGNPFTKKGSPSAGMKGMGGR